MERKALYTSKTKYTRSTTPLKHTEPPQLCSWVSVKRREALTRLCWSSLTALTPSSQAGAASEAQPCRVAVPGSGVPGLPLGSPAVQLNPGALPSRLRLKHRPGALRGRTARGSSYGNLQLFGQWQRELLAASRDRSGPLGEGRGRIQ